MALTGDTFDFQQGNVVTSSAQLVDNAATAGDVLTVQADKSIAAAPGGSRPVLSASIALNNAQIKALPGTDMEIVAAPGAGKLIMPLCAFLLADFAVAYSGIDADTEYPALWVAHANNNIYLSELIDEPDTPRSTLTDFLTQTNEFGAFGRTLVPGVTLIGGLPVLTNQNVVYAAPSINADGDPSAAEDAPLKLGADNSINFGGGDAANTLIVTALYTILDVPA